MTDWQKVKVEFTDADGNEVSAVMWQRKGAPGEVQLWRHETDCGILIKYSHKDPAVKITPIRELPTGVGAVVRVSWVFPALEEAVLTLVATGEWIANDGDIWPSADVADSNYEVLSGGVQL